MVGFDFLFKEAEENNRSGQDRRRFNRLERHLPLQFRNIEKNSPEMSGSLTRDISGGGIRFVSSDFLPVQTSVGMQLSLESNLHTLPATARVVWVQKLPYNENFMIGLEFLNIENENRAKIIRYVNEHSQRLSHSSPT